MDWGQKPFSTKQYWLLWLTNVTRSVESWTFWCIIFFAQVIGDLYVNQGFILLSPMYLCWSAWLTNLKFNITVHSLDGLFNLITNGDKCGKQAKSVSEADRNFTCSFTFAARAHLLWNPTSYTGYLWYRSGTTLLSNLQVNVWKIIRLWSISYHIFISLF